MTELEKIEENKEERRKQNVISDLALGQMRNTGLLVDVRLTEDAMGYLWDIINNSPKKYNARSILAGNISKSNFIQDKDDIIYNQVLKRWGHYLFFKNWNNYYDVNIAKTAQSPEFELEELWVNYQKQYEFNPPHNHRGVFSFVIFMKIPTHWKEQHALPFSKDSNRPTASDFQFILGQGNTQSVQPIPISLSPEDEGRMLFFPASLIHQVFPFYGTEEERVTVSGNIFMKGDPRFDDGAFPHHAPDSDNED